MRMANRMLQQALSHCGHGSRRGFRISVFLVNQGAGPMGAEASKQHFSEVESNHSRVERTVLSAKTCQEQRSRSKRKLIPLTRVARTHPRRLCRSCPR